MERQLKVCGERLFIFRAIDRYRAWHDHITAQLAPRNRLVRHRDAVLRHAEEHGLPNKQDVRDGITYKIAARGGPAKGPGAQARDNALSKALRIPLAGSDNLGPRSGKGADFRRKPCRKRPKRAFLFDVARISFDEDHAGRGLRQEHGVAENDALAQGMQDKAAEFRAGGAQIYVSE